MKPPLLPFCALFCLALGCVGQTVNPSGPNTKTAGNNASSPIPPAKVSQTRTQPVQNPTGQAPVKQGTPEKTQPATDPKAPGQTAGATPDLTDPLAKTPCGVDAPDETPAGAGKPYVIGPLDVLQISVWGSPNLSTYYDVGNDGLISMHLIGQIKAAGETKASLAKIIRSKLGVSVFECPPEVNVQVAKINSKKFFVYGEVGRPGEYPLVEDMTLMDAFANVGNFGPFANTKKIYVLRGDKTIPFNYNDVKKGKHMETNIKIENGDRIFVP